MASSSRLSDRRKFLNFLAASPVMAYSGVALRLVEELLAQPLSAQETSLAPKDAVVIKSVKEALTILDFDAAARSKLSAAHYMFLTDGSFYNETVKANREGFAKYQVRMRQLTGINKVDQSVRIFGVTWDSPIYLCPVGRMNGYYPQGNLAVARAAKATRTLQIKSGVDGVDEVNAARGEPVWVAEQGPVPEQALVKRAEAAGCPTFVWTVDEAAGANTIGAKSLQHVGIANMDREADSRCGVCHSHLPPAPRFTAADPMDLIGAVGGLRRIFASPTWDDVKRVRDMTRMKFILKGIQTREDADLAVQHGADAVMVSNHGGHADASGRGAIDCLPEVVAGAAGRIPVFIDSGFRSGMDVFKALALGATAVGVGRPFMWGLAAFGQDGVETVITLLRRELQVAMAQTNAPSIDKISRDSLVSRS